MSRALGPWARRLTARRDGSWYVWRRGLVTRGLERRERRRAHPSPFTTITLAALRDDPQLIRRWDVAAEERVVLPAVREHPLIAGNPTWDRDRRAPARVVVAVQRGQVFGGTGWVGLRGAVLNELGNSYFVQEWRHRSRLAALVGGPELPGRSVSLTQLGFANYFHWTLQGLPRLIELLEVIGGPTTVDRFVHSEPIPSFVRESLQRLGVGSAQLHRIDTGAVVTCESLVGATLVPDYDVLPASYADSVRSLYADSLAPAGTDILFVSRRMAPRRHLLNETKVVAAVERLGGRVVTMEGMSVAQQAARLSSARCVIGVHGAALANTVFTSSGAAVLELLPANLTAATTATLCRSRGQRYDFVIGTEPVTPRWLRTGLNDADVRVDVAEMTERLAALLG